MGGISMTKLYMGGVNYETTSGAPWITTEIFTVGCNKRCPGCINYFFQESNAKHRVFEPEELAQILHEQVPYRRLTISGGEPFLQAKGLAHMLYHLRKKNIEEINPGGPWVVLCYSGYTFEELMAMKDPWVVNLLLGIDILVDGPFVEALKYPKEEFTFVGSTNQRIIDVPKTFEQKQIVLFEQE